MIRPLRRYVYVGRHRFDPHLVITIRGAVEFPTRERASHVAGLLLEPARVVRPAALTASPVGPQFPGPVGVGQELALL